MKNINILLIAAFILTVGIPSLYAVSDPIVFPKEGQSREQQRQDKDYCKGWAQDETGINPDYLRARIDSLNENMANQAAGKSRRRGRNLLRGAALGAAMGGLDDAIDSKAGSGAARGAVLLGAKGHEDQRKAQEEAAIQSQYAKRQQLEEQLQTYMRAFSVCMDAKGYSVK